MFNRLMFVLLCCCAFAVRAQDTSDQPIALLTENFPPYNMADDGKNFATDEHVKGIAADLVREMFKRADIPYSLTLRFPWERIYKLGLEKPGYGVFVMARLPEREKAFKWVGPLGPDDWILLARADSPIKLETLAQARRYKIGAYKGDAIEISLTEKGMNPVIALRDQDNASKLKAGEIDLWATGDPAGRYLARQLGITDLKTVLRFNSASLFLALNKNTPDEVVAKLQMALDEMRSQGFVDEVMGRYL
jgi:polar amino acid transport system substrate-binding protein